MTIVISEDLWWPLPDWFMSRHSVAYHPSLFQNRNRLLTMVDSAEALIVRNKTQVDTQLLDLATDLKVVGRLGVGLDNIDVEACQDRGIAVVTARGCNADSVAEYVIASMLLHARFLHRCDADVRAGHWDRKAATGTEIGGKTLGLIGVGDIARRVAIRARSFGVKVIGYDPYITATHVIPKEAGVRLTDLNTVIARSDYLSIHVPLNVETRHLIGTDALARMKPTAVLINTSRGGVIDEVALQASLLANPKQHAVLDVREQEPPSPDDPLFALPNVTLSPHVAGITDESSERVAKFVLEEVDKVLSASNVNGGVV